MCIFDAVMIVSLFRNLYELPSSHLSIISSVETCNVFALRPYSAGKVHRIIHTYFLARYSRTGNKIGPCFN